MKKVAVMLIAVTMQGMLMAQTEKDREKEKADSLQALRFKELDEVVVNSTRVEEDVPVAHENVTQEELAKNNQGVDIPVLLDQQTSVVTTTDAGAGVGYTGIRIRGSDGTRINVTVNGIPINDPESHGVFWVNMPDLASSTNSIQIQRGVGTSTNGAGAFGASLNINTLKSNPKAFGVISNSYGSFNTIKNTVEFGTGLIDDKFIFEGRLSNIQSDGYIDRASSDLKSYYVSGSYIGDRSMVKAIAFSGHEKTYQAWYGVPQSYMDTNRTFNPYTYDNEIDNYKQSHYQLHYVYDVNDYLTVNAALHYTRGLGYFEQYKGVGENAIINYFTPEYLPDYGLDPVITAGDTIYNTDLIRRRWLDNHFYGTVFSAEYEKDNLNVIFGGGANQYYGLHYGEVIWAEFASNGDIRHPYYNNDALKNDYNLYAKAMYDVTPELSIFGDMQVRNIQYTFYGFDNQLNNVDQTDKLLFFNPKGGAHYQLSPSSRLFGFFGVGNKEPNRNDYTMSTPDSRPKPETMYDTEIGYTFGTKDLMVNVNAYSMDYRNQLILTGELNDVGAAIRDNVPVSYRRGVEVSLNKQDVVKGLHFRANATYSQNRIKEFREFIDDWDTGGQTEVVHQNTEIAFSPSMIASGELSYDAIDSDDYGKIDVALIGKYVGEQYIDNTSSEYAKLDDYVVTDARLRYTLKGKFFDEIVFTAWARNLLNTQYVANAWVYRFNSAGWDPRGFDPYANAEGDGGQYNLTGLFPQAGRNYFVGLTLKF